MKEAIDTKEFTHIGYKVKISVYLDHHMGEPWKEHDGHGIVSEWESRDKRPGELVLNSDRGSKRYYDYAATLKIARRDGWGLSDEHKTELAKKLGRAPTNREITEASVMRDFEHLKAWCNDEWHWVGFTTEITAPDGRKIEGESVWGYDDQDYMLEDAEDSAKRTIERESAAFEDAACRDIVTV